MQFSDDLGAVDWIDGMHAEGRRDIGGDDGRHVCARCFSDAGIAAAIEFFANSPKCDFCGRRYRSDKAAPVNDIAQFIVGCLRQDYDMPENVLFIDHEDEWGWAGSTQDKWDLIQDYVEAEWEVIEALVDCVTDDHRWCEKNPASFLPGQQLGVSWESFSRYVKHRSRFMFLRGDEHPRGISDEPDDSFVPTRDMLDLVGHAVVTANLIRTLGPSARIFRARPVKQGKPWHSTAADLGPPAESDKGPPAGRMSPAGIPIFYGALDEATALSEALESGGRVSVGVFSPLRPLRVLDLSGRNPLPFRSIFENVTSTRRGLSGFVDAFTADIAITTERDGREHINYVPSQIVTEYFRRVFLIDGRVHLDGIIYPSTRNEIGRNLALFVTCDEIEGISGWRDKILRFRPRSTRRYQVRTRRGRVVSWTQV